MIGLFFGDTEFPKKILLKLKQKKQKYIIVDLSKQKFFRKNPHSQSFGVGQFGKIFKSKNLSENISKLNKKFKDNILVKEVLEFINKNKKRPICTPHSN